MKHKSQINACTYYYPLQQMLHACVIMPSWTITSRHEPTFKPASIIRRWMTTVVA